MSAAASRLRPFIVLREAARVYREHWLALMGAALLVFAPLAVVDGLLEAHETDDPGLLAGGAAAQMAAHLLGDVLYAGIVAAAAIAWRRSTTRQRPLDVARALPWATIVGIDVVLAVGTAALSLLLLVPGIVFFTYFALAPALAKIDHLGVRASLRRSAGLVRGSFWRVLAVLATVTIGAGLVEQTAQSLLDRVLADVLVNLAVEVVSAPVYGLATVLMALHLGDR